MGRDAATATASTPESTTAATSRAADAVLPNILARGLLGAEGPEFERLAEKLRHELEPDDQLEGLQIDIALVALSMFRQVVAALPEAALGDPTIGKAQIQAHRLLMQSLREFRSLRADRRGKAPAAPAAPAGRMHPAGFFDTRPPADPDIDALPMDPDPDWRARVEFPRGEAALDDRIRATWPRVRGTEHLVEYVAALLADPELWTTSQVLQEYPDLTIADLRAVKGCDAENLCGPPPA